MAVNSGTDKKSFCECKKDFLYLVSVSFKISLRSHLKDTSTRAAQPVSS